MFFCLLFPKKRALFEKNTDLAAKARAGPKLQIKIGREQITPCRYLPPTPSKASQTGRRGARGRAPTAIFERMQRPWVQTVTKYAPGAGSSYARRRSCFRLGRSISPASRSLIGATLAVARFLYHAANTSKKAGVCKKHCSAQIVIHATAVLQYKRSHYQVTYIVYSRLAGAAHRL